MIELKRIITPSCCGKTQTILELNFPITADHLQLFINCGYTSNKSYTNAGLLFIEDTGIVATGAFGSNRIQIKCKLKNCEAHLNALESVIKNLL